MQQSYGTFSVDCTKVCTQGNLQYTVAKNFTPDIIVMYDCHCGNTVQFKKPMR